QEAIFHHPSRRMDVLSGISSRFRKLSRSYRQVAHVLLTRPPLVPQMHTPKGDYLLPALDLHVLGTPPAFVLSQDQTLHRICMRLTPINHFLALKIDPETQSSSA